MTAGITVLTAAPVITGTLTVVNSVVDGVIDLTQLTSVRVQVTGTWVGTVLFQTSVDGTNWVSRSLNAAGAGPTTATTSNNAFYGDVGGRYFRVTSNPWTSGTATVTIQYTSLSTTQNQVSAALRATSSSDAQGAGSVDEMALGAFNGSTIDRLVTSASAAANRALLIAAGSAPFPSINGAGTAPSSGTPADGSTARGAHTLQVDVATTVAGTAGTHTVVLEGSLDNTYWTVLGTVSPTSVSTNAADASNHANISVNGYPYRYVRARWSAQPTTWTGTLFARVASS